MASLLCVAHASVADGKLTVVSFGGAYGAAQQKHLIDPFVRQTGIAINFIDYAGGTAQIREQVASGDVTWDVVDIEVIDLERACAEGLLENIPRDILPAGDDGVPAVRDFIPGALASPCGVGVIVWSVIYAYHLEAVASPPTSIQDFFDVAKFPGKRALRKRPQVNLEWALLADGVSPADVYPLLATTAGQDHAFAKLGSIKKDIVWFDSWSDAPQLLADGTSAFAQSANGRIYNAIERDQQPLSIVWDGHVFDLDVLSIVKGSRHQAAALEFISFATQSKPLAGLAEVSYGSTRRSSHSYWDPTVARSLPTAHLDKGIRADSAFWAKHGAALEAKFDAWLLK